ncbi:MAG TPA: universal stress protein [Thermoanaerobaculia bacterium]|nr:universal stress protein [Thermoanaerobaculia bacterium]
MKKLETILIGTSLSEASDEVVRDGLRLATAAGARVFLVYAFTPTMAYSAPFIPLLSAKDVLRVERAPVEQALQQQILRVGIPPERLAGAGVEIGPPHRVVMEVASRIDADLIVLGAVERPRMAKLFGSTADRVLRKTERALLVLRGRLAVPPRRVLLPVDLSPLSGEELRCGLRLLEGFDPERQAELEGLFVMTDLHREIFLQHSGQEDVESQAANEVEKFLRTNAAGAGWQVQGRVESGYVDQGILARIQGIKPDLVVIGTHGAGGFERFLIGSVAASVVREAPGSVLVIPPEAARDAVDRTPAEC